MQTFEVEVRVLLQVRAEDEKQVNEIMNRTHCGFHSTSEDHTEEVIEDVHFRDYEILWPNDELDEVCDG